MIHADDPQVAIEMYKTNEEAFKQWGRKPKAGCASSGGVPVA